MIVRSGQILVEVDSRKRLTLGALVTHQYYIVTAEPNGVITLTPAIVMPANEVKNER